MLIAFIFIDLLLLGLALSSFGIAPDFTHQLAGWSELMISISGFYGVGGYLINNHIGFTLIPMRGPTGMLKKKNKQKISTASYVILFVILIRLVLKKAPKVISYALRGVVAFRLQYVVI